MGILFSILGLLALIGFSKLKHKAIVLKINTPIYGYPMGIYFIY